ncbi:MAG: CPBP family intramembrane metalloprotease [Actinobacteria bacterium]|nr:CPBP family intramembrane metalloprotease [Actinomycetota bacterium]
MGARLGGWAAIIGAIAALGYASRISGGRPERDVIYQWDVAIGNLVQYGVILGFVVGLSLGRSRQLLALRRPRSWRRAALIAAGVLVSVYALGIALDPLLHAGREQGLTPPGWDPDRAPAFAVNFVAIAAVAPVVEELLFRGLGFSLLQRFGQTIAILAIGVAFGLWHGLVFAFPLLAAFGAGLAYLRSRTDSVYPGILVHAAFNALALTVAVTT